MSMGVGVYAAVDVVTHPQSYRSAFRQPNQPPVPGCLLTSSSIDVGALSNCGHRWCYGLFADDRYPLCRGFSRKDHSCAAGSWRQPLRLSLRVCISGMAGKAHENIPSTG